VIYRVFHFFSPRSKGGPRRGSRAARIGRRVLPTLAMLILLPAGCDRATPASSQPLTAAAKPVEARRSDGDIDYVIRAERDHARVADRLSVTQIVTLPDGRDVHWPKLEEKIGDFQVHALSDAPPVPEGTRRRWQRTLTLEPLVSGELELPEQRVTVTASAPASAPATDDASQGIPAPSHPAGEVELAAGPLRFVVDSWIAGTPDPSHPRDVRGPLELEREPLSLSAWLLIAAGAMVIALIAWRLLRQRRAAAAIVREPPPHEWAEEQLRRLAAERLPQAGRVHEYYFRLSDVIRRYIERRFGLMAPERTTDEFLREARRSTGLNESHRTRLADFLTAADMVKFARHEPDVAEADAALDAARAFVRQTAPPQESGRPAAPAAEPGVTGRAA